LDIFTYNWEEQVKKDGPLARRMAPRCLDEFAGQEHLLSHNSPLRRLIEEDLLSSVIFYGPPGTGKTALARIIATKTKSGFIRLNAVTAGVKDVRSVIDEARVKRSLQGKRTILFIDEIHRFNKVQQDALLPAVEEGLVYLIGATTENPFFSLVPPLLSRTLIFTFESLSPAAVKQVLERALTALPAEQREILLLRELEDMSYVEIAATLGINEGTVKSRLARARVAALAHYRHHAGESPDDRFA